MVRPSLFVSEGTMEIITNLNGVPLVAKVSSVETERFNQPLYTAEQVERLTNLLNLADHALEEHSFNNIGDVITHTQEDRDKVRELIRKELS